MIGKGVMLKFMVITNDVKLLRINMFTIVGIKILTKHVLRKAGCQRVQQPCTSIQINNKKIDGIAKHTKI